MKLVRSVAEAVFLTILVSASFFPCWVSAQDLGAFKGLSGKIDIAGGTAHIPVMTEAARRIMTANSEISITIAGGGSGVGVQKVGEGLVDIGNTGRALSEEEKTKYGLESFPFAIDGVAVVVHPKNTVESLTSDQVRKIFSGEIQNWKEVGGFDAPIHLYNRDEASGTREVFWKKLLNKGSIVESANVVSSNGAMKAAISKDMNGFGYVSIGHIDQTIKAPKLDGIVVNQQNAKSGEYFVVRKLYMNTKGKPSKLVQAFIDFILGSEGAEIVKGAGYLPLS